MEGYVINNGNSGISRYQIGTNYIQVEFTSVIINEYNYSSAGGQLINNF